ncbi:MAG: hypothetical protein ACFFCF_04925 [Promethearchaeota archaeon]
MPEEFADFRFLVGGVILGIIFGVFVGVPLWMITGYPDYVRLFFFLGVTIGGATGAVLTGESRRRKKA